jgi:hypothetical protein
VTIDVFEPLGTGIKTSSGSENFLIAGLLNGVAVDGLEADVNNPWGSIWQLIVCLDDLCEYVAGLSVDRRRRDALPAKQDVPIDNPAL